MNLHGWDWVFAAFAALLVGVSKTGITGLGLLFVSIFAAIMPARSSTGVVLPLLIVGDIVAFLSYRRHAQWRHLLRLFPWAAAGVLVGYAALGRMNDRQTRVTIGVIVLALSAMHIARKGRPELDLGRHAIWFGPLVGILAGFTTLVANASGPLMIIYLLAMRLPKMEYMGTGAVFFFLLNLFKLPFMIHLGLVNRGSLCLNLALVPAVLLGTWIGRWILTRMDQGLFENIALALTVVAGAFMVA